MRASTAAMHAPTKIAVVAKHAESFRVTVGLEPTVNGETSSTQFVLSPVRAAVLVDVINTQEPEVRFTTTGAYASVGSDRSDADVESMPLIDGIVRGGIGGTPTRSVFSLIGDQPISVFKVILSISRSFACQPFRRRQPCRHD